MCLLDVLVLVPRDNPQCEADDPAGRDLNGQAEKLTGVYTRCDIHTPRHSGALLCSVQWLGMITVHTQNVPRGGNAGPCTSQGPVAELHRTKGLILDGENRKKNRC